MEISSLPAESGGDSPPLFFCLPEKLICEQTKKEKESIKLLLTKLTTLAFVRRREGA